MTTTLKQFLTTPQHEAWQDSTYAYREGLKAEDRIKNWLTSVGVPNHDSTTYQNIFEDIDCITSCGKRVSIKQQDLGVKTGNLCFETKRLSSITGQWEPSWFEYGNATHYLIGCGNSVFTLRVEDLKRYIDEHGWCNYRTEATKQMKLQYAGKRYVDYQLGLLSIQTLLDAKVMREVHQWKSLPTW